MQINTSASAKKLTCQHELTSMNLQLAGLIMCTNPSASYMETQYTFRTTMHMTLINKRNIVTNNASALSM